MKSIYQLVEYEFVGYELEGHSSTYKVHASFETKEEALQTLKSWGVDMVFAQQEGVTIEGVN